MANQTTSPTQNRFETEFTVTYPDFPSFKVAPQSIRIIQERDKQDVIHISYATFNKFYTKAFEKGVLVKVVWVNSKAKGEFYGQVYKSKTKTQATIKRNAVVKGVGATFPLKDSSSKVWLNKTAPEIVSDICKMFKLKPIVGQSTVRLGYQSMSGLTYWEKIQELANRIGFHAQVIGTTLYFLPIDKMVDQFATVIPILSYHDGDVNAGVVYEAHTLDSFEATSSGFNDSSLNAKRNKTVTGIDYNTGKVYSATASPDQTGKSIRTTINPAFFNEISHSRVASSKAEAQAYANGLAHLARFSHTGYGEGQGDPRVAPYKTVEILGTGEDTDGQWVVTKVEHFITYDGRYTIDFHCMADGTGKSKSGKFRKSQSGMVATRNVQYEMSVGGSTSPAVTKLKTRQPVVNQSKTGFSTTSSRWVGI